MCFIKIPAIYNENKKTLKQEKDFYTQVLKQSDEHETAVTEQCN